MNSDKRKEYRRRYMEKLKADPVRYAKYLAKRAADRKARYEKCKREDPEFLAKRAAYVRAWKEKRTQEDPNFMATLAAATMKNYYKDVEKTRARYRKNRADRLEERRAYDKAYYQANREKRIAQTQNSFQRAADKLGISVAELYRLRKNKKNNTNI